MQLTRSAPPATRPAARLVSRCHCAASVPQPQAPRGASRRSLLAAAPLLLAAAPPGPARAAEASGVTVDADVPGFGKRAAQEGDLLLVHYKGTLSTGEVFDSTLGGEVVRTNASSVSIQPAAAVPRAISLRVGDVQPGVCAGLRTALLGMRVGGKRTVTVPPELGFGQAQVAAPYAVVPPGSTLRYELQLLRLSSTGPDALFAGVAQCGIGGAGAQMAGCDAIVPQE